MTNLLRQAPGRVWSLWEMTGAPPQPSVARTALSLAAGTAPTQETVTSAGMLVMSGATVSLTSTSVVQVDGQPVPLLTTFKVKVKLAPQSDPALTLTV